MSTKARGQSRRVYITGDTLTGPHLDDIAHRFGPVDTVVAHLGGTRILFNTVTLDAREGLALLRQVPAKRSIAIHYDDYGSSVRRCGTSSTWCRAAT